MTQISKKRPRTPLQAARRAGPLDSALAPRFFKALADPTRAKLLACLAKCGRACSVGEVAECCSVDFSVVSRHLALLERSGVLRSDKRGRAVYYAVCYEQIAGVLRKLAEAFENCCATDSCNSAPDCCVEPPARGPARRHPPGIMRDERER